MRKYLERREDDAGFEWLSATDLARRLSDVLDAVQYEERAFKVSRATRLVAVIRPVSSLAPGEPAPPEDAPGGRPALNDVEQSVLQAVGSAAGRTWGFDSSILDGDEVLLLRTLTTLETAGLATSDIGGYRLTPAGRRLARGSGVPSG
ncbi:MAG TPA: hypothetical protein VGB64_03025 [Actinomycetota bacterium]